MSGNWTRSAYAARVLKAVEHAKIFMGKKNWYAIDVDLAPSALEAVELAFDLLNAEGTEHDLLGKKVSETIRITGYFNSAPAEDQIAQTFESALEVFGLDREAVVSISSRDVEDQDWLAEWKKHWKPTQVGRFVVSPPWERNGSTEPIEILIEPNMAFGTGTHPTTQLCLEEIGLHYKAGQNFLDVGTGTGILAIAAALMSCQDNMPPNIAGYDVDAASVEIARLNAKLNEVAELVEFHHGPIRNETPRAGFVCANLTMDVINPILGLLFEKADEFLVLSGILKEQENEILGSLSALNIDDPKVRCMGEWISVTIRKYDA